jgi:hypothetical protein
MRVWEQLTGMHSDGFGCGDKDEGSENQARSARNGTLKALPNPARCRGFHLIPEPESIWIWGSLLMKGDEVGRGGGGGGGGGRMSPMPIRKREGANFQ